MIPDVPVISEDELKHCRETGDYSPVIFEWYKFVSGLCFTFANLKQESPIVRKDISPRNYGIMIGLLNRFAKLMLANVALSHEGSFGESTSILDRCIFESCILLSWLSKTNNEEAFDRYVADGLRTEIELKDQVKRRVDSRAGKATVIEQRMLNSVRECFEEAGFDEKKIISTKKLPDIASMLDKIGHERFSYTVGQRIGSHHVHGTWVGLRNHYIELTSEGMYRTMGPTGMHVDQYIYVLYQVLESLADFVFFAFENAEEEVKMFLKLFEDTAKEVDNFHKDIIGDDFTISK